MPCNVSTCSLNTADQNASFVPTTVNYDAHGSRHIKRNEDLFPPIYINHAARRRDYLYRREDAPLAPRRQRCLPAANKMISLGLRRSSWRTRAELKDAPRMHRACGCGTGMVRMGGGGSGACSGGTGRSGTSTGLRHKIRAGLKGRGAIAPG
jgi:hypothetical protein